MMHPRLNSERYRVNRFVRVGISRDTIRPLMAASLVLLLLGLMIVTVGECADVPLQTARQVAALKLQHHLDLHGSWNGALTPTINNAQAVEKDGIVVAYNFTIHPSGHVLVAVDDELTPVPLYSTRSTFLPERITDKNAVESWMIPLLKQKVSFVKNKSRSARSKGINTGVRERIKRAWDYFSPASEVRSTTTDSTSRTAEVLPVRAVVVEPLLTTAWGQDTPYNLFAPSNNCSGGENTLTGCVATAWSQVMRYWEWPDQGTGSHAYRWNGQTISADFNAAYDWDNMPGQTADFVNDNQRQAVAQLMFHVAVAADMNFGCTGSSSMAWADNILDTYFNYKAMAFYDRSSYSAAAWFALFKAELDADPPRPVILSIFTWDGNSGHEVVVDGYDDGTTSTVHINFGWLGYEDGYYDVTDDDVFNAGGYDWDTDTFQYIVTNIEPNYDPRPEVTVGIDQVVDEGDTVYLAGTVIPDGSDINAYQWLQVGILDTNYSDLSVTISGRNTLNASFTAPSVSSDTDLVFLLKATDTNRSVGFDKVTITVRDTDTSTQTSISSSSRSSGGGGGGCFISSVLN